MSTTASPKDLIRGFSIDRLLLFSDAVFAIAITFLAIDIRVPQLPENLIVSQLNNEILGLAPKFVSFLLTFYIIGSYWINYHRTFSLIKRYDRGLISLNILFLMFIVLLPFPNDLIGKYPNQQVSIIIYAFLLAATGSCMGLLWIYASSKYRLIDKDVNPDFIKHLRIRLFVSPSIFLCSIPFSFLNPLVSIIIWGCAFPVNFYVERTFRKTKAYITHSES